MLSYLWKRSQGSSNAPLEEGSQAEEEWEGYHALLQVKRPVALPRDI
jgi:hypothetical protein